MKFNLMRAAGLLLVVIGSAVLASARLAAAPEIDPASGVNALALVSGAALLFRSRRR